MVANTAQPTLQHSLCPNTCVHPQPLTPLHFIGPLSQKPFIWLLLCASLLAELGLDAEHGCGWLRLAVAGCGRLLLAALWPCRCRPPSHPLRPTPNGAQEQVVVNKNNNASSMLMLAFAKVCCRCSLEFPEFVQAIRILAEDMVDHVLDTCQRAWCLAFWIHKATELGLPVHPRLTMS